MTILLATLDNRFVMMHVKLGAICFDFFTLADKSDTNKLCSCFHFLFWRGGESNGNLSCSLVVR